LSANGKGKGEGEGDEPCEGKEHLERRETEGKMELGPRGEIILWESSSARIGRRGKPYPKMAVDPSPKRKFLALKQISKKK
jgi:hypothetical protein